MDWIPITAVYMLLLLYTSRDVYVCGSDYSIALLGIDDVENPEVTYQLVITNLDTTDATDVMITVANSSTQLEPIYAGAMYNHTLDQSFSVNGSGITNKTIHVTSQTSINLQVFSKRGSDYIEGFLAIPREDLFGPRNISDVYEYVATTFCATGGFCQIAVSAFEDGTNIYVEFPAASDEIVFCNGASYFRSHRDKLLTLNKFDVALFESASDITGTHIYSRKKPISVVVGTRNMSHGGVLAHMVEQLHPTSHWGTEYVVRPLGQNGYGDILKISTQKDNTTIDMKGFPIIVVTNKRHNVWRRLDKDMESYIKASKPIEVVQITGLAYGSANDTLKAGMTVVPAIENGARLFKSSCGEGKDGEFHIVTEISAQAETMVGNASFTEVRKIAHTQYLIGSINATANDVHDVVNENADIRGVVKCEGTAVMALGLVHQQMNITQEHKVPPPEEILCKEMLTGSITLNHRAQSLTRHEVKFDPKTTIMQLRLRSCGPFSIQFLEKMKSIGNYFLFTITKKEILVRKCYTNCEKRNITETSGYNGEFNCKTDMQLYWFRLDSLNEKLCFGTGPFADRKNCNNHIATNSLFERALMTSSGKAEFNYDLETEEDCDYRMSAWRCEDKTDHCQKYGKNICNDHPSFANNYCAKLCKRYPDETAPAGAVSSGSSLFTGSPDNYGRKFIVILPSTVPAWEKCYIYVSGYRALPNVAVGSVEKLLPVDDDLSEGFTKVYTCPPLRIIVPSEKAIVVISDVDVSVTVLYSRYYIISYPIYPVDTYGTEIVLFDKYSSTGVCDFISEFSSMKVIPYLPYKIVGTPDRQEFEVGIGSSHKVQHTDYKTVQGLFRATKPFTVFCGPFYKNGSYQQNIPAHTFGTTYYVPAFETSPSDFPFDISLRFMAKRDNTVVTIDGDFNAVHPLSFSGDFEDQRITGSDTYTVTATHPIALAVVLTDLQNPDHLHFHVLPPSNVFLETQMVSIPNHILSNFSVYGPAVTNITSYNVDSSKTSSTSEHNITSSNFVNYSSSTSMYGITVVRGESGKYFSLSGHRTIANFDMQSYCHTTTPDEGDKIDNDCDGLVDEDTCYSGYAVYSEDYDLDGAFSDDCCSTETDSSIIGRPTEPECLEIQKPANQCWTHCRCNCKWLQDLENYEKMTEAEKEALQASFVEQQKKEVVDTSTLSSSTAQKASAKDRRQSAASIGYIGIALFTIVFGIIFILDIKAIVRDLLITATNIKEGCERLWDFVRRK